MFKYPKKKIFQVNFSLKFKIFTKIFSKKISLKIPEATLGEMIDLQNMEKEEYGDYFLQKLEEWGVQKWKIFLLMTFAKDEFLQVFMHIFFLKNGNLESIVPASVMAMGEKKKHEYNTPEDIIFAVFAKNYKIPPHKLLDYSLSEITFLSEIIMFANLNEEQEAELARLERVKIMQENKEELDKEFEKLAKMQF